MVRSTRPSRRASSNGVFFAAVELQRGALEHPGQVEIDHDDVGGRAGRSRPALRPSSSAGRVDMRLAAAVSSGSVAAVNEAQRRPPAGSRARPRRAAASANGMALAPRRPADRGPDIDHVDQAVGERLRPARARSSSARSGGDSLKKVR